MEKRGQERHIAIQNFLGYNPSQLNQESPVKLPLAPIVSTPPDRRGNATVSTRRGSAIFSPTQTLDHHRPLPPPPPQPLVKKDSTPAPAPDPDPAPDPATSPAAGTAGASNSKSPPPQGQESAGYTLIRYRECLKNHAAKIGGHVVDGCGEFMPSGEEGTPEFLRCAACDCHRSFHRKEVQGNTNSLRTPVLQSQSPLIMLAHHHKYSHTPPVMVAFGENSGGAAAEASSEDLNLYDSRAGGHATVQPSFSRSKKRFRTKFSQKQKDKMHELAAKLGWRIQKQDEQEVQEFCNEMGVKREVFKVWLHNNKQAIRKRQI